MSSSVQLAATNSAARRLHMPPGSSRPASQSGSAHSSASTSPAGSPKALDSPSSERSRFSFKALSLTLVGLNGLQKQSKMAAFTMADDLKGLKELSKDTKARRRGRSSKGSSKRPSGTNTRRNSKPRSTHNLAPSQSSSGKTVLTPMTKRAVTQRAKLNQLLSESASMTAGIDALLNKINTKRNKPAIGGGNSSSHRRQLSRSLPNLQAAMNSERQNRARHKNGSRAHTKRKQLSLTSPAIFESQEAKLGQNSLLSATWPAASDESLTLQRQKTRPGTENRNSLRPMGDTSEDTRFTTRSLLPKQTESKLKVGTPTASSPRTRSRSHSPGAVTLNDSKSMQAMKTATPASHIGVDQQLNASKKTLKMRERSNSRPRGVSNGTPAADGSNVLSHKSGLTSINQTELNVSTLRETQVSLATATSNFASSLRAAPSTKIEPKQIRGEPCHGSCSLAGAYGNMGGNGSFRGRRGGYQNQDRCLVVEDYPERGAFVYAVFDGHGAQGHKCSQFCADNFLTVLEKAKVGAACLRSGTSPSGSVAGSTDQATNAITRAFLILNRMLNRAKFDSQKSGTTATACILLPRLQRLIAINCGDSNTCLGSLYVREKSSAYTSRDRGVAGLMERASALSLGVEPEDTIIKETGNRGSIGRQKRSGLPQFRIKFAHKPHLPTNARERARIEASGGMVTRFDGDTDRVWGGDPEEDDDVVEMGGLAMSRSLGDEALHAFGVTAEPNVREMDLCYGRDQFIVLGSDGVWDRINELDLAAIMQSSQKQQRNLHKHEQKEQKRDQHQEEKRNRNSPSARKGATRHWNAGLVAEKLCHTARTRWVELGSRVDDVTAIVVNLTAALKAAQTKQ